MYSVRVKKNFDLARRLRVIYNGDYRAFLRSGSDIIRDDIISNIKHQITPSGSKLKRNKKKTLKIKRRLGKGQLSLIWDRVLISPSSWFQKSSKKKMKMGLTEVRKKIGRAVTKLGYKFMGISVKARLIILAKWRNFILRGLR
jgi:hypothetical protein